MTKLFFTIGSVALLGLLMSKAGAAGALKPDAAGYIRDWVMLAPIPLPEEASCADLIAKEQVMKARLRTGLLMATPELLT